MVNSFTFLQNC